jgi:hypothetical protein
MMQFSTIFAYVLGGLTLFPLIIILVYALHLVHTRILLPIHDTLFSSNKQKPVDISQYDETSLSDNQQQTDEGHLYKVGWLRVSRDQEQSLPDESIGDIVKNYIIPGKNKRENANVYFSVLKYNTLYLYDSEKQLDCKGVINLGHHTVQMHPPGLQDYELYSKPHLIKLAGDTDYYINCHKCIEKEDWYFAFLRASKSTLPRGEIQHDKTHFVQTAMNHLITMVHSDEHHFQTQWLNAILGRIFLGVYRTEDIKEALYKKVITKLDKINAKRPPFLGEITVRSVDPGHTLPRFTQPKLLGLSPTGELTAEAHMQYDGGFRIEIETVLKWKYSDRLRPLTMDLVLGITLKEIEGKLLIKIKEPPTNRFWYAFYECPKMEWKVEPVVWEKRVGYSVVVKAIEQKIQEFIMETMVLPHFDDITFFPTNGVGGIFEKSSSVDEETASTPVEEETVTAPVPIMTNSKKKKDRLLQDEALLTTARSLPELFSAAVPVRTPAEEININYDLSTSPPRDALLYDQQQQQQQQSELPAFSTSPDDASLLSSSPSSVTIEDRTISQILSNESDSSSCDNTLSMQHNIQITYSTESQTTLSSFDSHSNDLNITNTVRLRKSSSLALLKPKTGASTAINVSPAMAHKTQKEIAIDASSVAVVSSA